jgi:SAM-dependent methyltransferase
MDQAVQAALDKAAKIAESADFQEFTKTIRSRFPWRFEKLSADVLNRDYLRVVEHHLKTLIPRVQLYMEPGTRRVLDFGCGSGGSAIALAMVYPDVFCYGTDVDADEISVARERAKLYGVADRCEFHHVRENQALPFPEGFFDLCQCSSVLEYVVAPEARKFCVQEMTRLITPGGLLFISVPNRLYPFEVHSWWRGKPNWGWNYFPKLLNAHTVDSTVWEVQKLARPAVLTLHRTPFLQLLRPWSNFCLRRALE